MALPGFAAAGAQLAPLILSLFSGGRQQTDLAEQFRQLLAVLRPEFAPIIQSMIFQGQRAGAVASQRVAGSIGRAGGGSTGVGATARSVGAGLASSRAADAGLQGQSALLQAALGLFPSFRQQQFEPPTGLQNFSTALALATLGGQNPLQGLVDLIPKSTRAATQGQPRSRDPLPTRTQTVRP